MRGHGAKGRVVQRDDQVERSRRSPTTSTEYADSKAIGELVEEEVVAAIDQLEPVPDADAEWYDAEPVFPIDVDELSEALDVPVATLGIEEPIDVATPVEIKAARYRLDSGSSPRRGRFYYRRGQHGRLREEESVYAHAVYEVDEREDEVEAYLLGLVLVSPDVVDDVLGSWIDVDRRETYAQSSWGNLPFPGEVDAAGEELAELLDAVGELRDSIVPDVLAAPIVGSDEVEATH